MASPAGQIIRPNSLIDKLRQMLGMANPNPQDTISTLPSSVPVINPTTPEQQNNNRLPNGQTNIETLKASIPQNSNPIITDQTSGKITGLNTPNGSFLGLDQKTLNLALQQQGIDNSTGQATSADSNSNNPAQNIAENALASQQSQQLQGIDAMTSQNQQNLTTADKNQAAGLAFINSIRANAGDPNGTGALTINSGTPELIKMMTQALGIVSTTGIAGVSLSTLFNPASSNIKNLESDSAQNVAESTRIARAASTKGANVSEAIHSIQLLEDSTRFKYNQAQIMLRESPSDIRAGLDLQDGMARDLRVITENRQALERYYLTGDPKEVLNLGVLSG